MGLEWCRVGLGMVYSVYGRLKVAFKVDFNRWVWLGLRPRVGLGV